MFNENEIFTKRRLSPARLTSCGFETVGSSYRCIREILDGDFLLHITFDRHGNVETSLTDRDTGEDYSLYKTTAQGTYVGLVREAVTAVLREIADRCFAESPFCQEQTLRLLAHAAEVYGDEPEFLWESTPGNGILRRKDSGKWYAALLTIPKSKLGFDSGQITEIVNLHAAPAQVEDLRKRPDIYPGWHMNKKSWYTILLDGSVDNAELFDLLAESYRLAKK